MGQAADPARQEHELRKQALATQVQRFEALVRHELDWRARLRRNRTKLIIVVAGLTAVLAGLILLRSRLAGDGRSNEPATLDDVAAELHQIRKQLAKRGGEAALWQRLLLRGAVAAGSAAGAYAARRMMQGERATQEAGDPARTG